ncbi:hypothetical protein F8M41_011091 [Gigaspora margarita]|uniref:ZSWIM1/3 RNaseH-like domain-containing protein n=1 Tax=Gigaspora margarita TaxID=4874 RepID=A0A8H4ATZ4_GIGMA|nr:hypothetical protein F8M41_011091 [Gigaspora margarita]
MSHNVKLNTVWCPLFSNLQCIQVPLTETLSVLDLYKFDTISPGGGKLSSCYKILPEDCINRSRLHERDMKTIMFIDEHANQLSHAIFAYVEYLECSARNGCRKGKCNWKGRISVPKDKLLNLLRKTIANRVANATPSMLVTELINNSKILDTTSNMPLNHVQPMSTQFVPNLELIQNALKYDKKLHHPSVSELEKVCSLIDDYEAEGTVISKQYGIKDTQDPKKQAVLLGIASTIMPALLTKYPDFLVIGSTSCRNSLNFSNTAFMVRSDELHDRVVATFVSDKETIPVVDLMFELFIQYSIDNGVQLNPKWLAMDKWDPYLSAAKKHFPNSQVILCDWYEDTWPDYKHDGCPMKTNMLLESYFKKDMVLHYRGRYTKSLHSNLEKIAISIRVDSGEIERFWRGEGKPPTKSKLQREKKNMNVDTQYNEIEDNRKEDFESETSNSIDECNDKQQIILCVTCRSRKFTCSCTV